MARPRRTDPPAVIVRLAPGADEGHVLEEALRRTAGLPGATNAGGPDFRLEAPFTGLLTSAREGAAAPGDGAPDPAGALERTRRIVLAPGADPRATAQALLGLDGVEWAEPDASFSVTWDRNGEELLPNDPLFTDGDQWGLSNDGTGQFGGVAGIDIGAPAGWAVTSGSSSTVIGIVDTGFDLHHPDLVTPLFDGSSRLLAAFNSSIEGDAGTPDDSLGHGTIVAGVAAALTNNGALLDGRGVAGVCGGSGGDSVGCRLVCVKATPTHLNDALATELAKGIILANSAGARVINLSFGGDDDNDTVLEAISYVQNRGTTVVCGAGNGQDARPQYPGYYARYGVGVSVAGLKSDGTLARFSSRGPQIDVAAPGENIYSTFLTYENAFGSTRRNYEYSSGTSFAAPFVTGLAGLALTLQPSITDNEFQEFLRRTSRDLGAPGRDDTFGWGLPDAPALLAALAPPRAFLRGSIRAQSYTMVGLDSVTLAKNRIVASGCAVDGRYQAERWEVRAHITLPAGRFTETPTVIVRTHGSNGWSAGPLLEYNLGWGELVPGSATADGFDVRAYVYRIPSPPVLCSSGASNIGYVPVRPENVLFAWSAFGLVDDTVPPPAVTFAFEPVAPNPAVSSVAFRLWLPATAAAGSHDAISIHDARGRLAGRVPIPEDASGLFQTAWDGRDPHGRPAPPGVYFAQAHARGNAATRRFVLLRTN